MISRTNLVTAGLIALGACGAGHLLYSRTVAPDHATSQHSTPRVSSHRATGERQDGTRVVFRDRAMGSMIEELRGHRDALAFVAGAENKAFSSTLSDLIILLEVSFDGHMNDAYETLEPAQQAIYNDVAVLLDELRLYVGQTLTKRGTANSEHQLQIATPASM